MVMKRVKQSKYYFHGDNEKKLQNMFSATSTKLTETGQHRVKIALEQ